MNRWIALIYSVIIPATVHAQPPGTSPLKVKADDAQYKSSSIYLTGNVVIENEIGSMSGTEATVELARGNNFSTLHLRQNVQLSLPNGNGITCAEAMLDRDKMKATFFSNFSDNPFGKGVTTIRQIDPDKGTEQTVTCCGEVSVDHINHISNLRSPRENGAVSPDSRIHFRDRNGNLRADDATIWYEMPEGGQPHVSRLLLEGNVAMVNDHAWKEGESTPVKQYALAQKVTYTPSDQVMLLTAEPPDKVLFYDEVNNLQVSANGIEITRDKDSGENAIRGMGNVRFNLIDNEIARIDQLLDSAAKPLIKQ